MGEPLLITVPAMAERLSIGKTQAWELVSRREVPVVKIGRSTRVILESVDEWARSRASARPSDDT